MVEITEKKSNNLVVLKDTKEPEINNDLVELLEHLTNEAKIGDLTGIVFTGLYCDDGYKLGVSIADGMKFHTVLGILTEQVINFMPEVAKEYE